MRAISSTHRLKNIKQRHKMLVIFSLTAFLCCCGVQSAERSDRDLKQQIINSGTVVFLDFLEKVRNATEKFLRDDQFRKSRISIQGHMKIVREFAEKPMRNSESIGERQNNSDLLPQRFLAGGVFGEMIQEVFDRFFSPYMKIYHETVKNETVTDLWREVESNYLPGAPPVFSKPMHFFSHLLATAVVKSQLVNVIEAGLDTVTVTEIREINFNQLHKDLQMLLDQIRQKAFEISVLERRKEKNDFLVTLRTASGLIVFYWDKVLEHTESPSFHAQYMHAVKQWSELNELRNTREKYPVLVTMPDLPSWIKLHFAEFFEAVSQEYYNRGNTALGLDRFNQSNWAVVKAAVVYSIPVYTKLSEVGFITETNRFLHRVRHITLILEGKHISSDSQTYLEMLINFIMDIIPIVIEWEKFNSKDNQLLLPLRGIRKSFLFVWEGFLRIGLSDLLGNAGFQQSLSKWNHARDSIINELLKSNAFTRKQLEEAPKSFAEVIRRILDKLKQYTDLVDGFDEFIDPTISALERSMDGTLIMFNDVWDFLLE